MLCNRKGGMMKKNRLFLNISVVAFLSFSGCAARFTKTGDYAADARPANCDFSIYTVPPTQTYREIGLIDFSVSGPDMAKRYGQELVCKAGGNALILSGFTEKFGYTKGTVISMAK